MSSIRTTTKRLSSNDKVKHYLHCSTNDNNTMKLLEKTTPKDLFSRLHSSSEYDSLSSSSSSIIDSLSRSDTSVESSLSDPIGHCSPTSSHRSSDEDLDFNIGFEQSDDDDDDDDDDEQYIFDKNNADTVTLLGEPIVDDYFRQLSNATIFNDEYDDSLTEYYTKHGRASFLHDSTHTLCPQSRFSAYAEDEQQTMGVPIRSNSYNILPINNPSTFVEKAPKKVVRFADMMGLDLESIRYMTPPDQTTSAILQDCVRLQLGQIQLVKNPFDIPNIYKRTSSISSLPSKQYNLVSKNFTSPINITPFIYQKQILLECLYTKNATAYGTIRVHNCAYDKHIFVRLSHDEWETSYDIQASHSMNYSHDHTDTFSFQITLPKSVETCKRMLFAVCLQAMGQEFWDSNQGWNYVLDVFERR